jgi:hypothetical protein
MVILLGKKPGQMALTVMLYLPHSQRQRAGEVDDRALGLVL